MKGVDESISYPQHYDAFYPQTKAQAEQEIYKRRSIVTSRKHSMAHGKIDHPEYFGHHSIYKPIYRHAFRDVIFIDLDVSELTH